MQSGIRPSSEQLSQRRPTAGSSAGRLQRKQGTTGACGSGDMAAILGGWGTCGT
jgi:hypothetical protein